MRPAQFEEEDDHGREEQRGGGDVANPVLSVDHPIGKGRMPDPMALIGDRARENVSDKDEHAADTQGEESVEPSRLGTTSSTGSRGRRRERRNVAKRSAR